MPRIVFWNVHQKDLTTYICPLVEATHADVVVLNENLIESTQTLKVLRERVSEDFYIPESTSEQRFHCFCRTRELDLSEVHDGFRTSTRILKLGSQRTLLGLVHGIDPRNYDKEARQSFAEELSSEMRFVKDQQQTKKLVMLGDFNMNPYDRGMNLAAGLNAMMTRGCISRGTRIYHKKTYDFYYNPMWNLFGDNTEGPAGTVYDMSNQGPYGWSMLDQVIISHTMVKVFQDVTILTEAGLLSLMDARGRPDSKNASDHFPILVTLHGAKDEQLLA